MTDGANKPELPADGSATPPRRDGARRAGGGQGVRWLVLLLPTVAIIISVLVLRSGLEDAQREDRSIEQAVEKTTYPDRCYLDVEIGDLNPDVRSAALNVKQIFLAYGWLDFDDPAVMAAEKGSCANAYRNVVKKVAPGIYNPDVDKQFSRPFISDQFGRFSSARLRTDSDTNPDPDAWPDRKSVV